ncbi:MAG TPA: hypothetical protein VFZ16_11410 [Hyphomicrobiaceae bacterium]|nr:hypothetical protein [Hyphomicrobiaceae bacterium]
MSFVPPVEEDEPAKCIRDGAGFLGNVFEGARDRIEAMANSGAGFLGDGANAGAGLTGAGGGCARCVLEAGA